MIFGWWKRRRERDKNRPSAPDLPASWKGYDVPEDRLSLVEELILCEEFRVEEEEEEIVVNLYDDARVLVGDPAIEALPAAIAALPGVEEVYHEDREIIRVRGSINREQVEAFTLAHLARTGDPRWFDSR